MLVVGLTGGIASGKSTSSKYIKEELGVTVIDTDTIAREIVRPGLAAHREIVKAFGPLVLEDPESPDSSELDRQALGQLIFDDPQKRRILNQITHPKIGWIVFKRVLYAYLTFERMCVIDVPLLFESGWNRFVSKSILVTCDLECQVKRLMQRDGIFRREEALKKIQAQWTMDKKKSLADIVIWNDRDEAYLQRQLKDTITSICPSTLANVCWLIAPWIMAPISWVLWYKLKRSSSSSSPLPPPKASGKKDSQTDDLKKSSSPTKKD